MASRAGGGYYIRDDGQAMPKDLLKETADTLFGFVGKSCPKAYKAPESARMSFSNERATSQSTGDVLDALFENWLKNKVK